MPRKIKDITRATLEAVPLPVYAATYTVISHKSIMDYALAEITAMGFTIEKEEYRATHDGQIAQGIYQLNYNSDTEMSLMFAWTNSYNKQIRFKCAVGGYVHANQSVMLCGEIGTYARKHTGTADADTIAMMKSHLTNAKMYYDNLVIDKEAMKLVPMSLRRQSEILGVLFAEYEILTTEQASIMRQQMDKPSYFYNGGKDTLWSFYNHATVALQQSHPRTWMEDQRMLHWFITNEIGLTTPVVPVNVAMDDGTDPLYVVPNQTNILDQIAEIEEETELVQYIDPAGNTFELPMLKESEIPVVETKAPQEFIDALMNAPEIDASEIDMSKVTWVDAPEAVKEVEAKPKLSLDDILIRIPNEEKASLSPFEKMQQRLEEANARTEASLVLTPEEQEEYQEELDQIQALEAEVAEVIEDETPWHEETVPPTDLLIPEELETLQEKLEAREVKAIAVEILKEELDFDFDLGGDTDKPTSESNDFDFFS